MNFAAEALSSVYAGRLSQAAQFCQQGLRSGWQDAGLWGLLAAIQVEQGDYEDARLSTRKGLGATPSPADRVALYSALSRIWRLQADWDEALEAAEQAAQDGPHVGQALRALTYTARGDPAWLEEAARTLSAGLPDPPLHSSIKLTEENPWAVSEHLWGVVRVRIGAARARRLRASGGRAAEVLQPILISLVSRLGDAERVGNTHRLIELSVLQSLAMDALGDRLRAVVALERAVELAAPGRYRAVFLEEGEPLLFLLETLMAESSRRRRREKRHAAQIPTSGVEVVRAYTGDLLAAFSQVGRVPAGRQPPPMSLPPAQPILAPLTLREKEVLAQLAQGQSYEEIANRFVVSLPTVRSHIRSLYQKLGVSSRGRAVARGRELGIL